MLKNIGLFHFGSNDRMQPLQSLRIAIQEAGGKPVLKDSLIVLPEAFNLKGPYEPGPGPYEFDPDIECRLRELAVECGAAFVAGIIDKESDDQTFPYNSAYLITGTSCDVVLSRKRGEDDMADEHGGQRLYQSCSKGCDAPTLHQGSCIAALVCMDALEFPIPHQSYKNNRDRHHALEKCIADMHFDSVVMCVPARNRYFEFSDVWPNYHFVLANGCPAKPSLIKLRDRESITIMGDVNQIRIESLAGSRTKQAHPIG